jgi:hypothetical protein
MARDPGYRRLVPLGATRRATILLDFIDCDSRWTMVFSDDSAELLVPRWRGGCCG